MLQRVKVDSRKSTILYLSQFVVILAVGIKPMRAK